MAFRALRAARRVDPAPAWAPHLGKAEILTRAGVDESAWQAIIGSLVERGAVESKGRKRGTQYFALDADSPGT